ncbi:MAG: hypothetical protein EPO31_02235 [Gammaproteobacteria bacterium]|jgi:hypothetical protein|nr:MAG: hypothetical protein EPO31_02235 [Gammaproteobacteria bacterium]
MTALLRQFFRICLLRDRPQDLPAAGVLLGFCIGVYFATGVCVAWPGREFGEAVLISLMDTPILLGFTAFLLAVRSHTERWLQTATALAGAGTVFNLIAIPMVLLINMGSFSDGGITLWQSLLELSILTLLIWNIAVIGFIYRHALELPFLAALVVAFANVGLSVYLINLTVNART